MSKESAKQGSVRYPEAVQYAGKEPRCWGERRSVRMCEREQRGGREGETHLSGLWRSPLTASAPISLAVAVDVGGGTQVHRAPRR